MSGPADGTKNGMSINAGQSCSEFGLMCVYKHRPVCDWNQVISDEELKWNCLMAFERLSVLRQYSSSSCIFVEQSCNLSM